MNVLIIAPHPDDEVLGCGGVMARHAAAGDGVHVVVVTRGIEQIFPREEIEATRAELHRAHRILGVSSVRFLEFPAPRLDTVPEHEIADALSRVIREVKPTVVYLPHHGDIHHDHQRVYDATLVAARPLVDCSVERLLCYETLSETEWASPSSAVFCPTVFVDITPYLQKKLQAMACYQSQLKQPPSSRSLQCIEALARLRGATVSRPAAEAFHLVRECMRATGDALQSDSTEGSGVVVIGAGGHSKVVVSTLQAAGEKVEAILDDCQALWGRRIGGVTVTGPISGAHLGPEVRAVIAIGNNAVRRRLAESLHWRWISVIHPHAHVHPSCRIGAGTLIAAGTVIQPDTTIGAHAIVNTSASVDHDCDIREFAHVAPGGRLADQVKVGAGALLEVGSSVAPGVTIGDEAVLGAGGVAICDIPPNATARGVPARIVKQTTESKAA